MTVRLDRRGALVLGVGAAAGGLAGCSRFGGNSASPGGQTVNMVWKGDADRAKITREAIALFNKKYPKVKVTTDYQSGDDEYAQKLSVRFASHNPPDLMRMNREFFRDYGDRNVLHDLGSAGDGLQTDQIPAAVLNSGRVNGKLLGIAMGVTSMALFVNKKTFDAYHVGLPDMASWTWTDYGTVSAEISKASKQKVWGSDFPVADPLSLGVWLRQRDKDLWNQDGGLGFGADDIAEWFQTWVKFRDMGAIPPAGAIDDLGSSADQSPIGRGVLASSFLPPNSFSSFNGVAGGELTMGYYPGETHGEQRGMQIIPGAYWSISSASKDSKDAVALLNFLVNDVGANKVTGATNGVPANQHVAEAIKPSLTADDQTAVDFILKLSQQNLSDYIPDPAGSADLTNSLSQVSDTVRFNKAKPAEAARQFLSAAKAAIKS